MTRAARFDPSLLRTFLAVADAGRISAAARVLHLSQPAVTAQVRKLEDDLGAPLFARSARGVALTPVGRELVPYARRIEALLDEAAAVGDPDGAVAGELVLAASTTIAAHVVPGLLRAFRAAHPGVPVRVEVGNTAHVVARLAAGAVPLGLIEGHARAPGLRLEAFVDDELVAVARRGARVRVHRAADLATVPMIFREPGSGTRDVIERALARGAVVRAPRPDDLELGSTEAVTGAVLAGLGVAFLSRWSVAELLARGALVALPLAGLTVKRAFRWALPAGGLRGAARRFYEIARRAPPVLPPAVRRATP